MKRSNSNKYLYPIKFDVIGSRKIFILKKLSKSIFQKPFFLRGGKINKVSKNVRIISLDKIETFLLSANYKPSSGLIFHLSRCGSSIVAQSLSELNSTFVISEADVFSDVLIAKEKDLISDSELLRIMNVLISLFCQSDSKSQENHYFKFQSSQIDLYGFFQKNYPQLRSLYIYRSPIEILVSLFNQSSFLVEEILKRKEQLNLQSSNFGLAENFQKETVIAQLISRNLQTFISLYNPSSLLISYDSLPEVLFNEILPYLKLKPNENEIEKMKTRLKYSGKKASKLFLKDTEKKSKMVTTQMTQAHDKFILSHWLIFNEMKKTTEL